VGKRRKGELVSLREEIYAREYVATRDMQKAALAAGWAPSTAACPGEIHARPGVQKRIQALSIEILKKVDLRAEHVLNVTRNILSANWSDVASWDEAGVHLRKSSTLSPETLDAVKSVTQTISAGGGSMKVEMYSKLEAAKLAAQMLQLAKPNDSGAVTVDVEVNLIPRQEESAE